MTINEILINYKMQDFTPKTESRVVTYSAKEVELNKKYEKLAKMLNIFFKISNNFKVNGLENIAELKDSAYVVIANHKSSLDPIYLNCALKDYSKIRWISKIENFDNSFYKKILDIGQVIPLNKDRKMTPEARQRIEEVFSKNEVLGLFPEGTRNYSSELLKFHTGAARICIDNDVPYVPIAIVGKAKPFKGKVTINIGRPVYLKKIFADKDDYEMISIDMRDQLNELLRGNFNFFPALYEK
jgi:1-acyl-sn-glycerol-3-phosphate acyltransferase